MDIVADIGNTSEKLYFIEDDKIIKYGQFADLVNEIDNSSVIDDCIIVSVVKEKTNSTYNILENRTGTNSVILEHKHYTGLKSRYNNIHELGMDRLCNVAYAVSRFRKNAIIIDLGSAVTFEIIGSNGAFEGGMILPGIAMQSIALLKNTSLLPEVKVKSKPDIIGRSTKECILSGIVNGIASVCEEFVKKIAEELDIQPKIVITGGDAELISGIVSFEHKVDRFTIPYGALEIIKGNSK